MKRSLITTELLALAMTAALIGGCSGSSSFQAPQRQDIAAAELQAMMADGQPLVMLDVRTEQEFASGHIPGSINAPLAEMDTWLSDLGPCERIVCVYRSGYCSRQAADELVNRGFPSVYNVLGGINSWPAELAQ